MNRFFPVLYLLHRSTGCFVEKSETNKFTATSPLPEKKICSDLYLGLHSVWICLDLYLGLHSVWIYIWVWICLYLFGSIFGLHSVWICLNLFRSVWIYFWVCILFGSIFGFPFCLDLFGSLCILFGSVWICLDLFGSVWICLDLSRSVWICLNLFGSVWTCLDLLGSVWKILDLFYLFRSALINFICFDETSETTVRNL